VSDRHPSRWFFRLCILTLFCAAVSMSVAVNLIVELSRNWLSTSVSLTWISFWLIATIVAAVAAIGAYIRKSNSTYNPKVSLVRNGGSLIGVALSAFAFNFPSSWLTGIDWIPLWSTAIGWFLIALTLMLLEPIWKSEAAADLDARELEWSRKEIARLKSELAQQSNSKTSLAQQIKHLLEEVGRKVKELIP
jgi:hypothetical protein